MKLPNHQSAIIAIEKLTEYCLNPEHPFGNEKSIDFKSALNIELKNADLLKTLILEGLENSNCVIKGNDDYGKRFSVSMFITNFKKQAWVATGWIIKAGELNPRITSCYIKTIKKMKKEKLSLFSTGAILKDLPENKVVFGQVGTIVELLDEETFEVEFTDKQGQTISEFAVKQDDLMLLHHDLECV